MAKTVLLLGRNGAALLAAVSALGLVGLAVLPGYLWLAVVSVTLAVRRRGEFPSQILQKHANRT